MINHTTLYLRGPGFEYHPTLNIETVYLKFSENVSYFLSPYRQVPRKYFISVHDHFLSVIFQLITHESFCSSVIDSAL